MSAVKSSLVDPRYKTEYRVRNWREYKRGLRARGDVTIWYGTRGTRDWRKLRIGVDERGFIVAPCVTESQVDDASVVPDPLRQVSGTIEHFTADGAYDKSGVYEALIERRAKIVVPRPGRPPKGAWCE
jgi:hypothetical protein